MANESARGLYMSIKMANESACGIPFSPMMANESARVIHSPPMMANVSARGLHSPPMMANESANESRIYFSPNMASCHSTLFLKWLLIPVQSLSSAPKIAFLRWLMNSLAPFNPCSKFEHSQATCQWSWF